MKPRSLPFRLIALTLMFMVINYALSADPPALTGGAPVSVTGDVLKAKIKEVEATAGVDEATTAKLIELYRKALSNLETATANDAAADTFAQARRTAPAEAKAIRDALEKAPRAAPATELPISDNIYLAEIEQLLLKEKADLAAVEAKLADLDKQLAIQGE